MKVRVEYTVTIETSRKLEPVIPLWVRANGCGDAVSYRSRAAASPARSTRARKLARAVRRADRRGRRTPARRRQGHGPLAAECGGRRLLDTTPRYGMPDNLYYTARPILHEPGPVDTRYFLSQTGIQVRRGETLTLSGTYDDAKPTRG